MIYHDQVMNAECSNDPFILCGEWSCPTAQTLPVSGPQKLALVWSWQQLCWNTRLWTRIWAAFELQLGIERGESASIACAAPAEALLLLRPAASNLWGHSPPKQGQYGAVHIPTVGLESGRPREKVMGCEQLLVIWTNPDLRISWSLLVAYLQHRVHYRNHLKSVILGPFDWP